MRDPILAKTSIKNIKKEGITASTYVEIELSSSVEPDTERTVSQDNEKASLLDGKPCVGLGKSNSLSVQEDLEVSVNCHLKSNHSHGDCFQLSRVRFRITGRIG